MKIVKNQLPPFTLKIIYSRLNFGWHDQHSRSFYSLLRLPRNHFFNPLICFICKQLKYILLARFECMIRSFYPDKSCQLQSRTYFLNQFPGSEFISCSLQEKHWSF